MTRKTVLLRWTEEAEARRVRESALLDRWEVERRGAIDPVWPHDGRPSPFSSLAATIKSALSRRLNATRSPRRRAALRLIVNPGGAGLGSAG